MNAVRAIVLNPRYKGTQTYGRYHKVERLRSVDNPAAGHVTREVPSPPDDVLVVANLIEPIVSSADWHAAQPGRTACAPGPRPDRPTQLHEMGDAPSGSRYALRGLLICADCGRKMQGNAITRKKAGPRLGYRCVFRDEYPGDEHHPKSLFVAENRILPALDEWLRTLSCKNFEVVIAEMIHNAAAEDEEPPEIRRARTIATKAQTKLDRYMDAIEKGMDPTLYVERSKTAQRELFAARAVIDGRSSAVEPLDEAQLRELLERVGDVVELLRHADADERHEFYQELGLRLAYQRLGEREKVRASLGVEFSRVGGAMVTVSTHETPSPGTWHAEWAA